MVILSQYDEKFEINVEAFVMGKITNFLPSSNIKLASWDHIVNLQLADPAYQRSRRIDLVLGSDVFSQILMKGVRLGINGSPIAQQTQLGWILSGKIASELTPTVNVSSFHATAEMETLMERFWAVEAVEGDKRLMTTEEQWCEEFYARTHRRDDSGRFVVRLPFRFEFDPAATLGSSRNIAIKRLLQLERRFVQNNNLKVEYQGAINDHLLSGRMRPTSSIEIKSEAGSFASCYLPHHAVVKESSTSTKLRVVFDASRKTTNGKSLNDVLVVGPTIQSDIVAILINWRFHRIAFIADIQKMYLQVVVDERDVEYQRIVWRDNPSEAIKDFCLTRLTFGTSSAPYIAIKTLHQLAEYEQQVYPNAATVIRKDAYVDDVISGGDDLQSAIELQQQLLRMLRKGGFDLKKWASNHPKILEQVPEADREIKLPIELHDGCSVKTLGIAWNASSDSFGFKLSLDQGQQNFTKRIVLSTVAKLFDPIGLVAPVVVVAKAFMKKLWASTLDWDDELPAELRNEWIRYLDDLQQLPSIKVPRWIQTSKSNKSFQIHGFCDASLVAYGAAIYLRTVDGFNNVSSHLLISKSKITPTKASTIPRLELCGAYLLAKLLTTIRTAVRFASIANNNVFLWCDSQVVLRWLRGEPKRWKVFVENRVNKIIDITTDIQWRHVGTHDNPADLVSRGTSPLELSRSSLWWHKPAWLTQDQMCWPVSSIDNDFSAVSASELEVRRTVHANLCTSSADIIANFSTYHRLIRITTLCRRYIHHLRIAASCRRTTDNRQEYLSERRAGRITVNELQATVCFWNAEAQRQHYNDEIQCLLTGESIDSKSKLLSLHPIIDSVGLLRVGGRLQHSRLSYDERHPIILPPNHWFTSLLVDEYHKQTKHGGVQLMSALLRKKYWIINARNTIRHRNQKCVTCFRHRAETSKQLMGSLPAARSRFSRPFSHTGVDYCGPIDVRTSKGRGIKSYKAYIAVFVCLSVKAIHLECVDGLSTNAFLAAFQRFMSRRGACSDIYSDNGTNFLGASNELERQYKQSIKQSESDIAAMFTNEHIRWHFIPPGSPHFGGIWEAGVKSAKFHLKRVIGETKLTFEEMSTLLCQIEACLNSRPICPVTNDPDDLAALTPGHFLIGDALLALPEPSLIDVNPNRLTRWKQIQQMRQYFSSRWQLDYISLQQNRPKWHRQSINMHLNEMVLIKDDRLPPTKWLLGRVTALHPGADSIVRVVTVRTKNGTLKRNISKLCRLPIDDNEPSIEEAAQNSL